MTVRLLCVGLAALMSLAPGTVTARAEEQLFNCSISTSGVAFGAYSVFNSSPRTATGTVTYSCTLGLLVRVELSKGSSTAYDPRTMKNGASNLNYNLYLDSGYATVWGDGSGSTGRISHLVVALFQHSATAYGRIPALQSVPVGSYSDSITASIIF